MTPSPEWSAADDDDSDRATGHVPARNATHSPSGGQEAHVDVPDREGRGEACEPDANFMFCTTHQTASGDWPCSVGSADRAAQIARIAKLEAEVERQDCEFDAEMDRLEGRILGDEQCCQDACDGGACESCPGCCAGWCVNGHDFRGNDEWDRMSDEDRSVWYDVAREGNAGLDAALTRADAAEVALAEVRETLAKVAALADRRQDAVTLVAALHVKATVAREGGREWCNADGRTWPCPTLAALASAGRPSDGDVSMSESLRHANGEDGPVLYSGDSKHAATYHDGTP